MYKEWMTTDYHKKFKLQTWREKKYRKTTDEMGRWFPGGRNRPWGLSLIDEDDDDDDDDDDDYYYYYYYYYYY